MSDERWMGARIIYLLMGEDDPQVFDNQWIKFTVADGVVQIHIEGGLTLPSNHECEVLPSDLTILGEEALEQHIRIIHRGRAVRGVEVQWIQ